MNQGSEDRRNPAGALTPEPQKEHTSPALGNGICQGAGLPPPALAPDEPLGDRYRVIRFIARGGMAEVYEAEDLELRARVALKVIREEVTGNATVLERFKREVLLARQVSHPNVSRIFDLGHYARPGKPDVVFLTMELLAGETLADRLRLRGRLEPAEALPVAAQMAAALDAAHRAGVVHRDLKPSNVMLVASPSEESGLRVVVTDFGLACGPVAEAAQISQTGVTLGTPAYMAPEQVLAETVTPAADIYAFGLVLYEMITGRQPFEGDTPLSAAVKRLQHPAPSPRIHVADLDPRWETVILRCLEREPGRRFPKVLDVIAALQDAAPPTPKRLQPLAILTAGAAVLAAVFVMLHQHSGQPPPPKEAAVASAPVQVRRSVAVLGFKNLAQRADVAWLSTAFSEMLGSELAAGGKLRLISGEAVARAQAELSLAVAESLAVDTLSRVRSNLRADLVVAGSYLALGGDAGRVRLDVKVQDAGKGETVSALTEEGTDAEIPDIVSRTGARLRDSLGVETASASETAAARAAFPRGESARSLSEGLGRLRRFETLAARELLEKAVAAQPDHPLPHAALAEAWFALGYDVKAAAEAQKAFELSAGLSREERLFVEGRNHEIASRWNKAVEIYRSLLTFFPDNVDYGLRLAAAQTGAGGGKEALATLDRLRRLPSPLRDDPRIDLAEAVAAQAAGESKRRQAAAERAANKGEAEGAQLLVARARRQEAASQLALGDLDRAKALAREAGRLLEAAGDRNGAALALNTVAIALQREGDIDGARRIFEQNLAVYREIGNVDRVAGTLNNIAVGLRNQGDLAGARKRHEEALVIERELGRRNGEATTLSNLATILQAQGDLAGSRRLYADALAIRRASGDRQGIATTLQYLGRLQLLLGDLPAAKAQAQEALTEARAIGNQRRAAQALTVQGGALAAEDDLAGARRKYEEALAIQTEMGERPAAAETRLALALLSLEEGDAVPAEALARDAAAQFRKDKLAPQEARARTVIAQARLAGGRPAEAETLLAEAKAVLGSAEGFEVRIGMAVTEARIHAALGRADKAGDVLKPALAAATRAGAVALQFEVRLAQGELAASGRTRIDTLGVLGTEAEAKGFRLLARKARHAAAAAGRAT